MMSRNGEPCSSCRIRRNSCTLMPSSGAEALLPSTCGRDAGRDRFGAAAQQTRQTRHRSSVAPESSSVQRCHHRPRRRRAPVAMVDAILLLCAVSRTAGAFTPSSFSRTASRVGTSLHSTVLPRTAAGSAARPRDVIADAFVSGGGRVGVHVPDFVRDELRQLLDGSGAKNAGSRSSSSSAHSRGAAAVPQSSRRPSPTRPRNRPANVAGATARGTARGRTLAAIEAAASSAAAASAPAKRMARPRGSGGCGSGATVVRAAAAASASASVAAPMPSPPNAVAERSAAVVARAVVPSSPSSSASSSSAVVSPPLPGKKRRGRPRKSPMALDGGAAAAAAAAAASRKGKSSRPATTGGGRQLQVLPDAGAKVDDKRYQTQQQGKERADPWNFQRYYATKLLTSEEEYSLGMRVRFMMGCEEVHEELSAGLVRLPTIAEWAHACGFRTPDEEGSSRHEGIVETRVEASIRPAGSAGAFPTEEEVARESTMFLGNVGMGVRGPGRGRGRAARRPRPRPSPEEQVSSVRGAFPDHYGDDDAAKGKGARETQETTPSCGTPRDFVEVMLLARDSKRMLVQSNMRLVVSIARRYHTVEGISVQDLVQEGSLGLARAAEKYDATKGFKFSTYASWWIQQAIFRSMAYHSRNIRLPVHVHNILSRIRRVRGNLLHELGRVPTTEEIAREIDMEPEKLSKLLRVTRRSISMDMPKYKNNPKDLGHASDESLGDSIDGTSRLLDNNSPELSVDQNLFQDDLKEMLNILGDAERTVICLRYGLGNGMTRTVTSVAQQLRRTKSWVRSQECRALRKLRRPWYEKRLREHQDSLVVEGRRSYGG